MAAVGLTVQVKAAKKRDLQDHRLSRVNTSHTEESPGSPVKESTDGPWVVAQGDDRERSL